MERFIRRQNIERYRRLLETVTDEAERRKILKLLRDEEKRHTADSKGSITNDQT